MASQEKVNQGMHMAWLSITTGPIDDIVQPKTGAAAAVELKKSLILTECSWFHPATSVVKTF
jgi:hypothetical protein